MKNGMRSGIAAILLAVAATACTGSNLFTGPGTTGGNGAQEGALQGSVTAGGTGVGNVVVVIVGGDSARTNGQGRFVIPNLSPAAYAVSIRVPLNYDLAPGEQSTRTVNVAAGNSTIVNWQLTERNTTLP